MARSFKYKLPRITSNGGGGYPQCPGQGEVLERALWIPASCPKLRSNAGQLAGLPAASVVQKCEAILDNVLGLPEIDRRAIWVEPKAEPGKACYAMGASRSSWLVVRSK